MNSKGHIAELRKYFEQVAVPEDVLPMETYMKNQFTFLGVKSTPRKVIQRDWFKTLPQTLSGDEVIALSASLFKEEEREFQYTAIDLLDKHHKKLKHKHLTDIEELILSKSWWDTVDALAAKIVGSLLQPHRELWENCTEKWITSENIWLQRTALLFQLKYKQETDTKLLSNCIRNLMHDRQFFIQKAIGWSLREYSKTNPDYVRQLLHDLKIEGLAAREASKYI